MASRLWEPRYDDLSPSTSEYAGQNTEPYLFDHTIQDYHQISVANVCRRCLSSLGNYSVDAFTTADVSDIFVAVKFKPLGRRLDGLRLKLQIWMSDTDLPAKSDFETTQSDLQDDVLGEATVRKVRRMVELCNAIGPSLQRIHVDLGFASLTADNGYGQPMVLNSTSNS